MKKLLILFAFLAGIVGICAVIGATLPRDHVAAMVVTVAAPQVKVWTTITDPANYPSWRSDLKTVEVASRMPLTWKEDGSMGQMNFTVDELQAPSRMVSRITDEDQPFGGEWEYQIAPDPSNPEKAVVTITERGWVSNVLFRFVSRFVMGHESSIDKYLRALSRKFGPEATPARVTAKDSS
jgi:uncharacterized protein YndB with AHSA1/START domain